DIGIDALHILATSLTETLWDAPLPRIDNNILEGHIRREPRGPLVFAGYYNGSVVFGSTTLFSLPIRPAPEPSYVAFVAQLRGGPLGLAPAGAAPRHLAAWPNPSPDGRFRLALPAPATPGTVLLITDALGRRVARLHPAPGATEATLDLQAQPPGVYAVRLTTPAGRTATARLVR
ncbi:MAG: T9SS type A sorting domain-containing protein, partial [Hymenobacteraceae bacterium]|nr:T9SS type A sorting domain-containing protein [Hymenobacteraceae bacterium]